ncbi:MAG: aminomethyltransferase family protein, partial [Myxococcota bacterium]|nr:aminomethyltransferase family protein [Myxococcota bacterium]
AAFLSRVWTRNIAKLKVGRATYSAMCDEAGKALDDGVIVRLGDAHYRMTCSEPWLFWFQTHARGLRVTIEDTSEQIAALALQGPLSRDILDPLVSTDLQTMGFFRARTATLSGHEVVITRTGYTGDLGYELWMPNAAALPVWDALMAAGAPYGLEPIGLDALDVARIEAGFVLQGVDYVCAARCMIELRKSSPFEAGLGWTVQLKRDPFVGSAALAAEREQGSAWQLVGLELDWEAIEQLHDSYGVPPHLAPIACRAGVPLYDSQGTTQVGQSTSSTWSPVLKRYIALGQVQSTHAAEGNQLQIEYTVEYERRTIPVTVVKTPFFTPERTRSTPKKAAPAQATPTPEPTAPEDHGGVHQSSGGA